MITTSRSTRLIGAEGTTDVVSRLEEWLEMPGTLAGTYPQVFGPDRDAALPAAEEEAAFARSICEHPVHTLLMVERELSNEMLAIADPKGAVAVAGVMGGFDSEVTEGTTTVLLSNTISYVIE